MCVVRAFGVVCCRVLLMAKLDQRLVVRASADAGDGGVRRQSRDHVAAHANQSHHGVRVPIERQQGVHEQEEAGLADRLHAH